MGLGVATLAEHFDFDGPNDVAGQRVPPPFISNAQYYGDTEGGVPTVVAGRGVGGSQALATPFEMNASGTTYNGGAVYLLPRPLTKADGAVRISVMFFPQPSVHDPDDPSTRYWAHCGGLAMGFGKGPDANYQRVLFQATFNSDFVDTPQEFVINAWRGAGGIHGGSLGTFTPAGGFYQIIFDFNQEWSQVTNSIVTPNGEVRSLTQPHWSEVPIEWVMLDVGPWPRMEIEAGIYDNLQLPDIPVAIQAQPRDQTVRAGWNVTLASTVDGTHPRSTQWFFEEAPAPDGVNTSLFLPAVQENQAGRYHFELSNDFSSVTSRVATLVVTNPPLPEAGSVVAWGDSTASQTQVPPGLQAVAVAAGLAHSLALKPDGTVIAWGDNSAGQTDVPADLTDVVAIAAGGMHSLALRNNGLVTGWPPVAFNDATQVPTAFSNMIAVAAGYAHSIVLLSDHTIGAWIVGSYPPATYEDIVQIATGDSHFIALTRTGTVFAWGDDSYGQVTVPPDLADVKAIAVGAIHSVALKNDGTVVAWGDNSAGQTTVPADLTDVTAVAAGRVHSLALKSDGTVVAWGDNTYGQGIVRPGVKNVIAIAAYNNVNLAIMRGGIQLPDPPEFENVVWQWGVAELRVKSEPGWPCRIEVSTDLKTWNPLITQTPAERGWTCTDYEAADGQRFYRAVITAP